MQTATLARICAGTACAAALSVATMVSAGPAFAASTTRTDCMGNNCVRVHCDSDSGSCTRSTNFPIHREETTTTWHEIAPAPTYRTEIRETRYVKPMRYACDTQGYECHYTRSYFLDDYGTPVFDPGMSQ